MKFGIVSSILMLPLIFVLCMFLLLEMMLIMSISSGVEVGSLGELGPLVGLLMLLRSCTPQVKYVWVGGIMPPNISKFARRLVKSQPCCKRVDHNISVTFSFSNTSW